MLQCTVVRLGGSQQWPNDGQVGCRYAQRNLDSNEQAESQKVVQGIPWKSSDTRLLLVAISPLLLQPAVFAALWSSIPERLPMHIDASGTPDAWASRAFMAFLPVGIGAGQPTVLWMIARYSHLANSSAQITASNCRQIYAVIRRGLLLIALIMNLLVAALFAITVLHELGATDWGLAVALIGLVSVRLKRRCEHRLISRKRLISPGTQGAQPHVVLRYWPSGMNSKSQHRPWWANWTARAEFSPKTFFAGLSSGSVCVVRTRTWRYL